MRPFSSCLQPVVLAVFLAALVACGKGNSNAPVVDSSGKHPEKWIELHGPVALPDRASCTQCHGNDLKGGISKVSCTSATAISGFNCHATSPADNPTSSFHPSDWIASHGPLAVANTSPCTQCHGSDLKGGISKTSCMSAAISGFGCHATSPADNPTSSFHPADWIASHGPVAVPDRSPCTQCHGSDFKGGIAKVSCSSATAISGFSCHATSPASSTTGVTSSSVSFHPADWIASHGPVALPATTPCAQCHAGDLSGGISKISCMSATSINGFTCHASSPATNPTSSFHTTGWVSQHKLGSITTCAQCHASDMSGGIAKISCMSPTAISGLRCHATSPAVNPSGCVSCHNAGTAQSTRPYGPNGNTAPNRAGAHAKHTALAGVTCDSCHGGAGSGTPGHATVANATVNLPNTFKAKTITTTFGYDAAGGKCSAIICHGGQITPNWYTGATSCLNCHEQGTAAQTPQYNSFFSGTRSFNNGVTSSNLHKLHLLLDDMTTIPAAPIFCTSCHNTTLLAPQHFAGLITPLFEGSAASTIGGTNTRVNTYTSMPVGNCTTVCHVSRNWIN